jgi:hypothetical protein
MRYTPVEIHAHEIHAREMHAYEVHAREVHAHEVHAHEVHAHEVHTIGYVASLSHASLAFSIPMTWPSWPSVRLPLMIPEAMALFWTHIWSWSFPSGLSTSPWAYSQTALPLRASVVSSLHVL